MFVSCEKSKEQLDFCLVLETETVTFKKCYFLHFVKAPEALHDNIL